MTKRAERILVWQWGRRGAGPRVAVDLAHGLKRLAGTDVLLCLSDRAEILHSQNAPEAVMKIATYNSIVSLAGRLLTALWLRGKIRRIVGEFQPDVAICAMPGPLDLLMVHVLRRTGARIVVIVHDAQPHPGDGYPFQAALQRRLIRKADQIVTFSRHVADGLTSRAEAARFPVVSLAHPPFIGEAGVPPFAHQGVLHMWQGCKPAQFRAVRPVTHDPAFKSLPDPRQSLGQHIQPLIGQQASKHQDVKVENRWVAEDELPSLIEWADVVVLPYREASQSGVGAMAIASGRYVVATRVGGLVEQFSGIEQAVLCEPDPASVAKALERILASPPPIRACVDNGQEWEKLAKNILASAGHS